MHGCLLYCSNVLSRMRNCQVKYVHVIVAAAASVAAAAAGTGGSVSSSSLVLPNGATPMVVRARGSASTVSHASSGAEPQTCDSNLDFKSFNIKINQDYYFVFLLISSKNPFVHFIIKYSVI